ncbi:MAG: hypothetical protein KJ569_07975 [Candidatus Omnitrophica bacterium]|nr:hypothetical protein [Candidatus Omnitrophota bacterium]
MSEDQRHTSTPEQRGDDSSNPAEMISLSGLGVTSDGKLIKRDFFTAMDGYRDPSNDMWLTREDAKKLQRYMISLMTGSTAVAPLICCGPRCPTSNVCPFIVGEMAATPPLGRSCPVEAAVMKQKKRMYIDEYGISMESPTELSLIDELVLIEIYEARVAAQLAKEQDANLTAEVVIGADREGEPILSRQVSPLWEIMERLSSKKHRIIKRMVGDRQEKYKKQAAVRERSEGDASQTWASTRDLVQKMRQQAQVLEAEADRIAADNAKEVQPRS